MKNTLTFDGKIRKGKTCPYLKRCSMKTDNCPTRGKTKENQFSCAVARMFKIADEQRATMPVAEPVEAVKPVEVWNVSDAVDQKRSERFTGETWIPQHVIARA